MVRRTSRADVNFEAIVMKGRLDVIASVSEATQDRAPLWIASGLTLLAMTPNGNFLDFTDDTALVNR